LTGAAVTRFHVGDKITSHLYSKWLDGPIGLNSGDTLYRGPLPGGLADSYSKQHVLYHALNYRLYILHYAIILTFLAEKDELGSQNSGAAHSENGSEPPCFSALPYLKAESKLQA
jgi:hypothetical protein